jgi:mono/diheme cytochrome c family protein
MTLSTFIVWLPSGFMWCWVVPKRSDAIRVPHAATPNRSDLRVFRRDYRGKGASRGNDPPHETRVHRAKRANSFAVRVAFVLHLARVREGMLMRAALVVVVSALLAIVLGAGVFAEEPATAQRGARLFFVQGCYGCHTVGTLGTPIGPDLSAVGLKYPTSRLAAWLRDPAAEVPTAHMPKLELSPAEVDALAEYLTSLQRQPF